MAVRCGGWWNDTSLGVDLGITDVHTDEVYAAMDWLLARQEVIENKLARSATMLSNATGELRAEVGRARGSIARARGSGRATDDDAEPGGGELLRVVD